MFIGMFQKAVLYIKELQDVGLFGVMSNSRWFVAFGGSPFFYVMLPFIALLLSILSIINLYHLVQDSNKNFDKWIGFVVSAVGAICASISLYGAVISTAWGFTFAAGPWFFLGSVVLALVHQGIMVGLNAYRAYESSDETAQRMHYLQAALSNLFIFSLLAAITGTIIFVLLTPVAAIAGSIFALTAVALTAINIVWRITPYSWKQEIKGYLNLGKTDMIQEDQKSNSSNLIFQPINDLAQGSKHHRLFSQCDYSDRVKVMDITDGENYLMDVISKKIDVLKDNATPRSEKNLHKIALLENLTSSLELDIAISRKELLDEYPLAFQSFWADKGEVEQIFEAVLVLQDKYKDTMNSDTVAVEYPSRVCI